MEAFKEDETVETTSQIDDTKAPEEEAVSKAQGTDTQETTDDTKTLESPEPDGSDTCHNKKIGRRGEDAAAAFLRRQGFDILERNWVCPAGEADIIAQHEGALHFIEVKTRTSLGSGFPSEAVDKTKRGRYEKIAAYYLSKYEGDECPVLFDVVSILVVSNNRAFLRFHRNAFAEGEVQ